MRKSDIGGAILSCFVLFVYAAARSDHTSVENIEFMVAGILAVFTCTFLMRLLE